MTVKKKDLHRTQHAPAKLIIALGSTLLGAIWLWIKDPIPVILGSTATEAVAPWWYMLSAFPVLGLLLFDGWTMLHENGLRGKTIGFGAEVMLVVAVSFLRIELMLPISGHALLFSYALFHWFAASGRRHSLELAVAAGFFFDGMRHEAVLVARSGHPGAWRVAGGRTCDPPCCILSSWKPVEKCLLPLFCSS